MSDTTRGMSGSRTVRTFLKVGTCSEALCNVLNRAFDQPAEPEERASLPLAGGVMQHGFQCGMLWGATLAAGAEAYRRFGAGARAQASAVMAAARLVAAFRARHGSANCHDITGLDASSTSLQTFMHFVVRGGAVRCFRMAAQYAPVARDEIDTAFAAAPAEAPPPPVSCAAVIARRMGATDMQTVMSAGFAGGIGLSGGACGALGAAVWVLGLEQFNENAGKVEFKPRRALEAVDAFSKCTSCTFECSKIVGRTFADIGDHAEHLRAGGCSEILDTLASA